MKNEKLGNMGYPNELPNPCVRLTLAIGIILLAYMPLATAQTCVLDPIANLTAPDGNAGDRYGGRSHSYGTNAVSVHGDLIAVGAAFNDAVGGDSGAAYVYRLVGDAWQPEVTLHAADANAGDHFGASVVIQGDTAIVGAPGDDDGGQECGAVYVFRFSDGVWNQEAKLIPAEAVAGDRFGVAAAMDGEVIVIGAPRFNNDYEDLGAAYVYRRVDQQWTLEARLVGQDPNSVGKWFGSAVAIHGESIAVGAPWLTGVVYMFRKIGGIWQREVMLSPRDWSFFSIDFGCSLALIDDTLVVGVAGDPEMGMEMARVYQYADGVWNNVAILRPDYSEGAWSHFGCSVAFEDDVIVVGASMDSEDGCVVGAAYLFRQVSGTWRYEARLLPTGVAKLGFFGQVLSLSGSWIVVAAPRDDALGNDSGSARVYHWLSDCEASGGSAPHKIYGYGNLDCNSNYHVDGCDLSEGASADCNENSIPDECDIAHGRSADCNENGVPDDCDIAEGTSVDCNANGVPDECDLVLAASADCNQNSVPDECDIASGASADCNANGRPDECDMSDGTSLDCNANDKPDECDIADGTSVDCNNNHVPDECDLASDDCNQNGVPDECDIADGTSRDDNADNKPDECFPPDGNEASGVAPESPFELCGDNACGSGLSGWLPAALLGLSGFKLCARRSRPVQADRRTAIRR